MGVMGFGLDIITVSPKFFKKRLAPMTAAIDLMGFGLGHHHCVPEVLQKKVGTYDSSYRLERFYDLFSHHPARVAIRIGATPTSGMGVVPMRITRDRKSPVLYLTYIRQPTDSPAMALAAD